LADFVPNETDLHDLFVNPVIARNATIPKKCYAVTRKKCIKKRNNSDTDNAIKYPKDDDIVDFPDVNRKTLIDLQKSDSTLQNL
jgi:hypothetical protein